MADEAGEDDPVADARRDGAGGRVVAAAAEAAGHDQAMVDVGAFAEEQGPGVDEARQVLARLQVAEREDVRATDAEPPEEELGVGGRGVGGVGAR